MVNFLTIRLREVTARYTRTSAKPSEIPGAHFRFAIFVLLTNYLGFCKFSEVCEQVCGLEDCRFVEALKRDGFWPSRKNRSWLTFFPLAEARMHDVSGAAGSRLSLFEGVGAG
jgi:hypothetical protein